MYDPVTVFMIVLVGLLCSLRPSSKSLLKDGISRKPVQWDRSAGCPAGLTDSRVFRVRILPDFRQDSSSKALRNRSIVVIEPTRSKSSKGYPSDLCSTFYPWFSDLSTTCPPDRSHSKRMLSIWNREIRVENPMSVQDGSI